jgi:hypothetical protein
MQMSDRGVSEMMQDSEQSRLHRKHEETKQPEEWQLCENVTNQEGHALWLHEEHFCRVCKEGHRCWQDLQTMPVVWNRLVSLLKASERLTILARK